MFTNFATTQPYTNITHGKKQIQLINDKNKKEQKIKITINNLNFFHKSKSSSKKYPLYNNKKNSKSKINIKFNKNKKL